MCRSIRFEHLCKKLVRSLKDDKVDCRVGDAVEKSGPVPLPEAQQTLSLDHEPHRLKYVGGSRTHDWPHDGLSGQPSAMATCSSNAQ